MANAARAATLAACGLLVAGVVVALGLAWRLSRGPIELDSLTPALEAALSAPDGSATARIASTALEWDPVDRDVSLRVHDLRIVAAGGAPLASVPDLAVNIAFDALLRAQVVPRGIRAIGPHLRLVREQDGRLAIGLGRDIEATHRLAGTLLHGAPGARTGWSMPRSIGARDGEITFEDRATGTTWRATGVSLAAHREPGLLVIDRLAFQLPPTRAVVTGRIGGGASALEVSLGRLPTSVLDQWWPADVAPAVRRWVAANVSGGGVESARLTLVGSITGAGEPAFRPGAVTGRFQFAGLGVRWLEGMPPVTGIAGAGTFSRDGWQVRVARGELEELDVVRAVITPEPDQAGGIRVDTTARGPLSKVLGLLQRPPLKSGGGFPFRPGEISGGATARVVVDVPPERGTVNVRANGELRSVSMRRAFRGRNLNARQLRVDLDGRRFEMRGPVTVGHAALQLRWRDVLAGSHRGRRVVDVKGRLDDAARKALGVDLTPWLDGPVRVQARLEPKGPEATAMNLGVDLSTASLDLPLLNMVKGPGDPGAAQASLLLANGQVRAADDFHLDANGSSLTGRATFGPDESWRTAEGKVSIAPHVQGGTTATVSFLLRPAGAGNQLTATADDAGVVLRAIDTYADATGGRLQLTSEIRPGVPGVPVSGKLVVDKFTLTRSPIIAKVAALTSMSGVVDALGGGGLPISQLAATFAQRAGVVTLTNCAAVGPAMALTLRGTVDRTHDDLALEGTIVPNYLGLARLAVSAAPAGPTLSVTSSGGVQAADFSVSGSMGDPYVTARPASAMAPSVLRGLMRATTVNLSKNSPEDVETDANAKAKKPKKPKVKPRPRRRAPAAPSAPDTDTE